jgi:hypothetical protein
MKKRIVSWALLLAAALFSAPGIVPARDYNAQAGRFISVDPELDFPDNFGHPYAYVGLNPVNRTDPTGAMSVSEGLSALGAHLQLVTIQITTRAPYIAQFVMEVVGGEATIGVSVAPVLGYGGYRALHAIENSEELLVFCERYPNAFKGDIFELWAKIRLGMGRIPGLRKMEAVSTSYARGIDAPRVGNDLIAVGERGIQKVIEVTANVRRDFTKTDVLEYGGIAQRLSDLIEIEHPSINELRKLGIDTRFIDPGKINEVLRSRTVPEWFKQMQRYALVPARNGRVLVPNGVEIIPVP